VNVIVSFLEEEEAAELGLAREHEAAGSHGIRFLTFPIPDRGRPPSMRYAIVLLREIVGALEQGKDVAVHCRQGIGRSGLLAAGVLVTSGMSEERAIEVVTTARGMTVPETTALCRWIHQLSSERLAEAV
jgi:protein-tyrosine phosphatase